MTAETGIGSHGTVLCAVGSLSMPKPHGWECANYGISRVHTERAEPLSGLGVGSFQATQSTEETRTHRKRRDGNATHERMGHFSRSSGALEDCNANRNPAAHAVG